MCAKKLEEVIKSAVFHDKNSSGPTKKRYKFFPPRRTSYKSSNKTKGPNAMRRNLETTGEMARELHAALRGLVDDFAESLRTGGRTESTIHWRRGSTSARKPRWR